jgi:hypothetical protein
MTLSPKQERCRVKHDLENRLKPSRTEVSGAVTRWRGNVIMPSSDASHGKPESFVPLKYASGWSAPELTLGCLQ